MTSLRLARLALTLALALLAPPAASVPTAYRQPNIPSKITPGTYVPGFWPSRVDPTQDARAPATWHDPYGKLSKGDFSFTIQGSTMSFFAEDPANGVGFNLLSLLLCAARPAADGAPAGYVDTGATALNIDRVAIHAGNLCQADHAQGFQFDNVWMWRPKMGTGPVVNLQTEDACEDIANSVPGTAAKRCVFKMHP